MKPILTPTAAETLATVRHSLEVLVLPSTEGTSAYSYATTAIALCRHVERRIEHEGQILFDEIARLRPLLASAADLLEQRSDGEGVAAAIRRTLAEPRDPAIYPTLARTAEAVAQLRQHVCDVQEIIIPDAEAGTATPEVQALRDEIRSYIRWELEEQGRIVEPAFRGRGPRR